MVIQTNVFSQEDLTFQGHVFHVFHNQSGIILEYYCDFGSISVICLNTTMALECQWHYVWVTATLQPYNCCFTMELLLSNQMKWTTRLAWCLLSGITIRCCSCLLTGFDFLGRNCMPIQQQLCEAPVVQRANCAHSRRQSSKQQQTHIL